MTQPLVLDCERKSRLTQGTQCKKMVWGKQHSGVTRHGGTGSYDGRDRGWREDAQRRQHSEGRGKTAEVVVMEAGTATGLAEFSEVGEMISHSHSTWAVVSKVNATERRG